MEAVQKAREAVEVGRREIYEKAGPGLLPTWKCAEKKRGKSFSEKKRGKSFSRRCGGRKSLRAPPTCEEALG
jgi:hypothetical protein